MIGLIVKAPLAEDNVGSRLLDLFDHIHKVLLLLISQLGVILGIGYVEVVFCLGLGSLKWTRDNGNLGIGDDFIHLRMRELLIDEDSLDQLGLLERPSSLTDDLNQLQIDLLSVHIGHRENGIDCHLGEMILATGDNFG